MSERRVRQHLAAGRAWAWRLFSGHGPWRVVLDHNGIPADPPGFPRPHWADVPLPPGFRVVWLKEAAISDEMLERTLRKHCEKGHVWAWRIFSGEGHWRVVMNIHNEPADPPHLEEAHAQ
jgi:hypothetical protein